ncbi:uncharacterized protein LOC132611994 [Lycium barbarum]|uniref:uncharacterized protein LOC132611994 n=1 Tax=Lycium barbarum TaxID=112863 RepID=UPI00293ED86F|nr:uncharacterized protein LOC132611994 [Lycium barbarum]
MLDHRVFFQVIKNPKECKAVPLSNGRELEEVSPKNKKKVDAELIPAQRIEAEKSPEKVMKQSESVVTRPPPAFPQHFYKQKIDASCKKFLDILNSRVRSKIPPKLKDPGSFNSSITIGNIEVGIAMCDLGASINQMPISVFQLLGLDKNVPLIIGRGFLATVDAVIRARDGKMLMTVDGQKATFDVFKDTRLRPSL